MLAIFSKMFARVAKVDQGVDVAVGEREHTAASSAIATVRSALRDEFLTAKAVRAIAALAGNNFDGGFVDEFHA
jgi:hypothetical protein